MLDNLIAVTETRAWYVARQLERLFQVPCDVILFISQPCHCPGTLRTAPALHQSSCIYVNSPLALATDTVSERVLHAHCEHIQLSLTLHAMISPSEWGGKVDGVNQEASIHGEHTLLHMRPLLQHTMGSNPLPAFRRFRDGMYSIPIISPVTNIALCPLPTRAVIIRNFIVTSR